MSAVAACLASGVFKPVFARRRVACSHIAVVVGIKRTSLALRRARKRFSSVVSLSRKGLVSVYNKVSSRLIISNWFADAATHIGF
jgi:hypothetical protein